jgi:hypothetical protein
MLAPLLVLALGAAAAGAVHHFDVSPPAGAVPMRRNTMRIAYGPATELFMYLSNDTLFEENPALAVPASCCTPLGVVLPDAGLTFKVYGSISGIDVDEGIEFVIDTYTSETSAPLLLDTGEVFSAPAFATDGKNYISHGMISNPELQSAVGVARLVFSGTQIVEFDIVINKAFDIGDAEENASLIDYKSLLMHELFHVLGLADEYDSECEDSLMYGFISAGDTARRAPDPVSIACVNGLYGGVTIGANASSLSYSAVAIFVTLMLLSI